MRCTTYTHALYLLDCVLRLKTEKNNNEAKIITRVPQEARVIKRLTTYALYNRTALLYSYGTAIHSPIFGLVVISPDNKLELFCSLGYTFHSSRQTSCLLNMEFS